ncbi:hypothetical protein QTG54_008102 [Skeletonema marinoi]|uniref:F-box domain-containing protein n=1 Tax=Skeletonema marinoi TaxID=267567 RepID=A0AAD9DCM7_9STRA|nr:hypothetical protein QTG54_008102 [Skeletonema marinoi]
MISKRRRLLSDASLDAGCLSGLPNGILTHVANYLDAPSRLFFAAALATHQNTTASDERNTAIVGNEWSTLDFGDIEEHLAIKLSDGDISAVLTCIDAVNRLKTLKLTNCINIIGVGLEPLRGSTIIEQIDLSLVEKYQSPWLSPKPPISCELVLPILDSIIEREGCSLRHVQFPSVWSERGERVQFEQFIGRYNEMISRGGIINCAKCNTRLPEYVSWIDNSGIDRIQNYTCYECLKYYCEFCTDDNDRCMLRYCSLCERKLCLGCQNYEECIGCGIYTCVGCTDFTDCSGSGCDADICEDCIASGEYSEKCWKCERYFCHENCVLSNRCDSCKKNCCDDCEEEYEYDWPYCTDCGDRFCDDCNEKKGTDAIQICDGCDTSCCGDCRVSICKEEESNEKCGGCFQLAGPLLLKENKKVQKENTEVKAENKTLKDQIGGLKDYNNFLKEQLRWAQVKEQSRK